MAQNELGEVDGKRFTDFEPWDGRGVPLPSNCDADNPRQAFLWMFTAMPGVRGAPLIMPSEYWERQSWRMWILGARPAAECGLKYQPPNNVANAWTASGKWVPLDEPDPPRLSLESVVDGLGQADRADLAQVMLTRLGFGEPRPGVPAGMVRVSDMAQRAGVSEPDMIKALGDVGLTAATPESLVGLEIAHRIIAQMGL